MNSFLQRTATLLLGVVLLVLGPSLALAATTGVRDDAGFFSAPARAQAERTIAGLERSTGKDLLIESLPQVPPEAMKGAGANDKAALNRMFEQWSIGKAREHRVNGVYVLLTREPAHLQVVVGNDTQRNAFTTADRDRLVDTMLRQMRAKKYDEALLDGVNFVDQTIRSHLAVRSPGTVRPTPSPVPAAPQEAPVHRPGIPLGRILFLLAILVFGMFVLGRLLRGLTGGSAPMPGGFPGGGGGGFFRSLLGGVFGAAAGMWLYDQFTGRGTAWGSDQPTDNNFGSGSGPATGQDTDYTSSGGSFGDSSGDSGFGGFGGDSGGGGFGGGDSGGGGGGGGDF